MTITIICFGVSQCNCDSLTCDVLLKHFNLYGIFEGDATQDDIYRSGSIIYVNYDDTVFFWEVEGFRDDIYFSRHESVSLNGDTSIRGNNGSEFWECSNGILTITRDSSQYNALLEETFANSYINLCKEDTLLDVTFAGIENIDGHECYKIRIQSNGSEYSELRYIDKTNYYTRKAKISLSYMTYIQTNHDYFECAEYIVPKKFTLELEEFDNPALIVVDTAIINEGKLLDQIEPSCTLLLK